MTPQEFATKMRSVCNGDPETQHSRMDDLICELLRELGYGEGMDVFVNAEKWYA